MTDELRIKFTFSLDDPELDDERRQQIAIKLLSEIRRLDEVEKADRVENLDPEGKSVLGTLIGVLTADINIKNVKKFLSSLADHLGDKRMKINVKSGDKEATFEYKRREDIPELERVVTVLLKTMDNKNG